MKNEFETQSKKNRHLATNFRDLTLTLLLPPPKPAQPRGRSYKNNSGSTARIYSTEAPSDWSLPKISLLMVAKGVNLRCLAVTLRKRSALSVSTKKETYNSSFSLDKNCLINQSYNEKK